jgi:hypothetical protein
MNNDPYSWGNIEQMDRQIREQKEEFKKKELKEELKEEETCRKLTGSIV